MPESDGPMLFRPLELKGRRLRNRIVMPPMVTLRGITTARGREWYVRRAAGGVGLIIVESTRSTLFRSELNARALAPLVEAVHAHGVPIVLQLFAAPRREDADVNTVRQPEIEEIVADCAHAARVCREAGFDGIEPHGAHGFFLNQFFSTSRNRRTDKYGGSLENRGRLALEICRAVRRAAGDDFLLFYRHTPVREPDGYSLEESLEFAKALTETGVDVLDISPSTRKDPADLAAPFRRFGRPVIAVGRMDLDQRAEMVLQAGRADLIALGRSLIADPEWPRKTAAGRTDEIIRCRGCNEACFGNLRAGRPVGCVQRPEEAEAGPDSGS